MGSLFAVLTGLRDPGDVDVLALDETAVSDGYAPTAHQAAPQRVVPGTPSGRLQAAADPPQVTPPRSPRRQRAAPTAPQISPGRDPWQPRTSKPLRPGRPVPAVQPQNADARVKAPITAGAHRIVIIGAHPKVGATVLTYCLGEVLASLRADTVVALELDPSDYGLAHRRPPQSPRAAQDLARHGGLVQHPADLRPFTTKTRGGLDLIYTHSVAPELVIHSYDAISAVLERFYSIILIDGGSGRAPQPLGRAASRADQIVITGSDTQTMNAVLDWLNSIGRPDLIASAIAVLTPASTKDLRLAEPYLRARFSILTGIPYDRHLAAGGEIDPVRITAPAKAALLHLAAAIADHLRA